MRRMPTMPVVAYSPEGFDAEVSVRLTATTASKRIRNTMTKPGQGALSDPRPRGNRPYKVWVTPAERATIDRLTATTGLSASTYLRTLGMGFEPRSILDHQHVSDLLNECGNLGRLGGLLKLWLTDKPGQGAPETDVRRLLDQIGEVREQIIEKVATI